MKSQFKMDNSGEVDDFLDLKAKLPFYVCQRCLLIYIKCGLTSF